VRWSCSKRMRTQGSRPRNKADGDESTMSRRASSLSWRAEPLDLSIAH
jgi:hypothetical protein